MRKINATGMGAWGMGRRAKREARIIGFEM